MKFGTQFARQLTLVLLVFSFNTLFSQGPSDPCDVALIEVALVDITGLSGQPDFDDAHVCTQGDTIRVEFGTPGITCNPTAIMTANEFRVLNLDGYEVEDVIISGGVNGPYTAGTDYTFEELSGLITVDMNPGTNIQMDQSNPVIIDVVLIPTCDLTSSTSLFVPDYELDYSLPGNIPSQTNASGFIDLGSYTYSAFLNIVETSTIPAATLPDEEICRSVTIINNGQFSLLDTFTFCDLPDYTFGEFTSFTITPVEDGVLGTPIDGMPFIPSTLTHDSIEIVIDGTTFGGANSLFEVDGGVILDYCLMSMCPAEVNNSMLSAKWGCNGEECQRATGLESFVVNFDGIPDPQIERKAKLPADQCASPYQWEFRIVNDQENGGAFEIQEGEADAQEVKLTLFNNDCTVFGYENYTINYIDFDGTITAVTDFVTTEFQDSICFTNIPDLSVDDTLVVVFDVILPTLADIPLCEEMIGLDEESCLDPYMAVDFENRCEEPGRNMQSMPLSATYPLQEGNPIISFTEVEYTMPGYCSNGKVVLLAENVSGLPDPSTEAQDIMFYINKSFCDQWNLINFEYGIDVTTGNTTGIVIDDTTLDSMFVVIVPSSLTQGEQLFFSYEIELNSRDSDACFQDNFLCIRPDVKATWENCFGLRWFQEYTFPYKILDFKPPMYPYSFDPNYEWALGDDNGAYSGYNSSLEQFGGGAGPVDFDVSDCSSRNYNYRYQFFGIDYSDCNVFMRYKVAQINDDGTAGSVLTAADMAAGVASNTGTTTDYIIPGVGGAPDTLVVEVTSEFIESCIIQEELTINVQHASVCTSSVDPVKYYESYEVIFECNDGTECSSHKRSCFERVKDCYCGSGGPPPAPCYKMCTNPLDLTIERQTNGCTDPNGGSSPTPDPLDFGLACDIFTVNTSLMIDRGQAGGSLRCDTIASVIAKVNPGAYLDYIDLTAVATATASGAPLTPLCTSIPYDPSDNTFDLTTCFDWTNVADDDVIELTFDWQVKEDVPECSEAFMQEDFRITNWTITHTDGTSMSSCGSTATAPYFVGDPFIARMQANLEFENMCQVSASITMNDDCAVGNVFNDYRPGYILDTVVYDIQGIEFQYVEGSAELVRKGENGDLSFPIPTADITIDATNGTKLTFANPGTWPEELTRASDNDSLYCINFDIEFIECYDYSTDLTASSYINFHSCGTCAPKTIESPGGIEVNNPPEVILNCLGAPMVQVPNDSVTWTVQVGHTPSAALHYLAFDVPADLVIDELIDLNTGTDLLPTANTNGSVIWLELGTNDVDDIEINALYTSCDTVYLPVYAGWSCNDYPVDPTTGEFSGGEFCSIMEKELAVIRGSTALQAAFTSQPEQGIELCDEFTMEVTVKNVGTASNFEQHFCFYGPASGATVDLNSVCFAYPDTLAELGNPGAYQNLDAALITIDNPAIIIGGQECIKYCVDLSTVMPGWGTNQELLGAKFPEDNTNKYKIKWNATTDCDYVSGSKFFGEAHAKDRCAGELTSTAESSDIVFIDGLNPADFNRNVVVVLDTLIGACVGEQVVTVNLVSFPAPIGDDEYICVQFPAEASFTQGYPFNPVAWDLSTPVITPLNSGGTEYCWLIPSGTPEGVLSFNMGILVDPSTSCGDLDFTSFTKVSKPATCISDGTMCDLELLTSDPEGTAITVIPALRFEETRFDGEISCGTEGGDIVGVASVAIQNMAGNISPGFAVNVSIFEDINDNGIIDLGEELGTSSYSDGIFSSQIVFVEVPFTGNLATICNLSVGIASEGCACSTPSVHFPSNHFDLNLCTDQPMVCEGGQQSILCAALAEETLNISYSSITDPDLEFINTATGTFGPAPAGTYTYDMTLNLGNGCSFSGTCSMQVVGSLGDFMMTGLPSCPGDTAVYCIGLDDICVKPVYQETFTKFTCAELLENDRLIIGSTNKEIGLVSANIDYDDFQGFIDQFNEELELGLPQSVCYVNDFGVETEASAIAVIDPNDVMFAMQNECPVDYEFTKNIYIKIPNMSPATGQTTFVINSPCGGIETLELSYTSPEDYLAQITSWYGTTAAGASGSLITFELVEGLIGVDLDNSFISSNCAGSWTISSGWEDNGKASNYGEIALIDKCTIECVNPDAELTVCWIFKDINGNEIPTPTNFCCSQNGLNFISRLTKTAKSTKGRAEDAVESTEDNIVVNLNESVFIENPLNDILLYDWDIVGGDVLMVTDNCAYLRWDEVGTYEVCVTPLLSPEAGLDCPIPPICRNHTVRADDLDAIVEVTEAQSCNEQSTVSVTFSDPLNLSVVSICDSEGEEVYEQNAVGSGCDGFKLCPGIVDDNIALGNIIEPYNIEDFDIITIRPYGVLYYFGEPEFVSIAENCSVDFTNTSKAGIMGACEYKFNFETIQWFKADGQSFEDWLKSNLVGSLISGCEVEGVVEICNGNVYLNFGDFPAGAYTYIQVVATIGDPDCGAKACPTEDFKLAIPGVMEGGLIISNIEDLGLTAGDYTLKIKGALCGEESTVDFNLPEPPPSEVIATISCNDPTDCVGNNGFIDYTVTTAGLIDSVQLCLNGERLLSKDFEGGEYGEVEGGFSDLGVGTYSVKIFTECGDQVLDCNLVAADAVLEIVNPVITQFSDCAADDAQIEISINSDSTIDSIIWTGASGTIIKELGPVSAPHTSTIGPGIEFGTWNATVYTECGIIEGVYNISNPPPAAGIDVVCNGIAPVSCFETFGSLDLELIYTPSSFTPDSIVLSNANLQYVDDSGNTNVSFSPLLPGMYTVDIYSWDACNNITVECMVPEPENSVMLTELDIPVLPCAETDPDVVSEVIINYTTTPSMPIARVDWYTGSSVEGGTIYESHINPASDADTLFLPVGLAGEYCVVTIAGEDDLFSTCPRDTTCFTITAEECPPACEVVLDTANLVLNLDCENGSMYDVDLVFEGTGITIEQGLAGGTGSILVELVHTTTGNIACMETYDVATGTLSCSGLMAGEYEAMIAYINGDGEMDCMFTLPLEMVFKNVTGLEYFIEIETTPTACDATDGCVNIVGVTDNEGGVYTPSDFNWVLFDGFTPIATIDSPDEPSFCNLKTDLYVVDMIDPISGCILAMGGAIVENTDAEALCPLTVLPGNNCGPCDGWVIMPDSLGIIYRMQDALGNIIFPQNAPNEHIFVDVCPGDYQVIAFNLALQVPDECPSICDVYVPISEDGFVVALDTITASPCEIGDGRILVNAIGGNCSYAYELYDMSGQLLSDSPIFDPSASLCADKTDKMQFLNLVPGEYVVHGYATDGAGNPLSCFDSDTIILRDNDIKISLEDFTSIDITCYESADGEMCVDGILQIGELLEIEDPNNVVLATFTSADTPPFCVQGLAPGVYQTRLYAGTGVFACADLFEVEILEPTEIVANGTATVPSDCFLADAEADIFVFGGTGDLSIAWSDPSVSGFTPDNLGVGVYAYTVTDENNCEKIGELMVYPNPFCEDLCPEIVVEFAVVDAECGSENGKINLSVQEDAAFEFNWNNGETTQNLENIGAGVYCVTVSSMLYSDCQFTFCQEVDEIDGPILSADYVVECGSDGTITLDISEGTPDYMVTWDGPGINDGGPIAASTGFQIVGPVGEYIISAEDANGCSNYLLVEMANQNSLNLTTTIDNFPSCGENNGEFTLEVFLGTAPYEYYVNDVLMTSSASTTYSMSGAMPGLYNVKVVDVNGCVGEAMVLLPTANGPTFDRGMWSFEDPICSVDLGFIRFDGSDDATISYAVYEENSISPIATTAGNESIDVQVPPGAYYVEATNTVTACVTVVDDINLMGPNPLDFIVQYQHSDCDYTGEIEIVEIQGGYVLDDLSITITNGDDVTINDALSTTPSLDAGDYTISVCYTGSDAANTCCKETSVTIENIRECPPCEVPIVTLGPITCQEDGLAYSVNYYSSSTNTINNVGDLEPDSFKIENIALGEDLILTASDSFDCETELSLVGPSVCSSECKFPSLSVGQGVCMADGTYMIAFGVEESFVVSTTIPEAIIENNTISNIPQDQTITVSAGEGDCITAITVQPPSDCSTPCSDPPISISAPVCTENGFYTVYYSVMPGDTISVTNDFEPDNTSGIISNIPVGTNVIFTASMDGCSERTVEIGSPLECVLCQEIGGEVFYDLNHDGCQSGEGEIGVEGVEVYLYNCDETNPTLNNALSNVTTGADGSYVFNTEPEGGEVCLSIDSTYFVVFDIPNGSGELLEDYQFTEGLACGNDENGDNIDPSNGQSACYDPEGDDDDTDIDAGITPCESLKGIVFYDLNNDGCQAGTGETGVVGVNVYLFTCNETSGDPSNALSSTSTGADGSYSFGPNDGTDNVCLHPDSTYYVLFDLPNGFNENLEGYQFSTNESCTGTEDADDVDPSNGQSACYDPEGDDDDLDIDAGIYPCEQIGGEVFYDLNNDGCQFGPGETGVGGVTVYLFTCDQVAPSLADALSSTITDNDGDYAFGPTDYGQNVCLDPAQEYYVLFDLPNALGESLEGYNFSGNEGCIADSNGDNVDADTGSSNCYNPSDFDDDEDIDAGIYPCEMLGGEVFYDLNNDGCQSGEGETGVEGVDVFLYDCSVTNPGQDNYVSNTSTNSNGEYAFGPAAENGGVCLDPAVSYYVLFDIPNGVDELYEAYEFSEGQVCPGSEFADDVDPTTGQSTCYNPEGEDDDNDIDAGIMPPCESLGGVLFYDLNNDGCQAGIGESGVEGVDVYVFLCNETNVDPSNAVGSSVTDANGAYEFGPTQDGGNVCLYSYEEYYVLFDLPNALGESLEGYNFSRNEGCIADSNGDNVDADTGLSNCYNPSDFDDDEDIDAGIYPCEMLGGEVFFDINNDGCQNEDGETGVEGVDVFLYDCSVTNPGPENYVSSTSTNSDGKYAFGPAAENGGVCLDPAVSYYVLFDIPNGVDELYEAYEFSQGDVCPGSEFADDVDPTTGQSTCYNPEGEDDDNDIDAGIMPPCESLGGVIFYDLNNDGCQAGPGESGVSDVSVYLFNCDAVDTDPVNATASASTDENGAYTFGPTPEGGDVCLYSYEEYFVVFDLPNASGESLEGYNFSGNEGCFDDSTGDNVDPGTGASACYDPSGSDDDEDIDAGIYPCEMLGGEVFYDLNNDGCQNGVGEIGVTGVDVYLYDCSVSNPGLDNYTGTTSTNNDGKYAFGPAAENGAVCLDPAVEYYVVFDLPNASGESLEGYNFSGNDVCPGSANADDVNNETGQSDCYNPEGEDDDEDIDAGVYPCEMLGGTAFYDLNNDGCQNGVDEIGVEGVEVLVFDCNTTDISPLNAVGTTLTDENGDYAFGPAAENGGVCLDPAEEYYVVFNLENGSQEPFEGYYFSSNESCAGSPDADDIDPTNGQSSCYNPDEEDDDNDIDAGIYPCESIGGEVFLDLNNDGCEEGVDEIGLKDVEVYLYTCDVQIPTTSNAITSVTTDAEGAYEFNETEGGGNVCLDPALEYFVVFDIPNEEGAALEGYEFSEGDSCPNTPDADNVISTTGQSECYNPEGEDEDEDIDAGIRPNCEVPTLAIGSPVCNGASYDVVFYSSVSEVTATIGDVDIDNLIVTNIPVGMSTTITATTYTGCETEMTIVGPTSCNEDCVLPNLTVGQAICSGNDSYSVSFTAIESAEIVHNVGILGDNVIHGIPSNANLILIANNGDCSTQINVSAPEDCTDPCADPAISLSGPLCAVDGTYSFNYIGTSGSSISNDYDDTTTESARISGIPDGTNVIVSTDSNPCSSMQIEVPGPILCPVYDLALIKELSSAGPFEPGDLVTFTITVYNQGDIDASNIEITDYIPAGLSYQGDANGWTGSANGPVTNVIASLPAYGTPVELRIDLKIDEMFMGDVLINNAAITKDDGIDYDSNPDVYSIPNDLSDDNDPDERDGGDDEDPAEIVVGQIYDLALMKEVVSAGPYAPGSDVTYEITVCNQGSLDAAQIQITDYIPEGMSLSANDVNGWTGNTAGPVNKTIASLPAYGPCVSTQIILTIDADFTGASLSNNAAITADNGDDIDSDPDVYELPDDYDDDNNLGEKDGGDDEDPALITIKDCLLEVSNILVGECNSFDDSYDLTIEFDFCNGPGIGNGGDIRIGDYGIYAATGSGTGGSGVYTITDLPIGDGGSASFDIEFVNAIGCADVVEYEIPASCLEYDLAIKKEVITTAPFVPGQDVEYLITICNQGTTDANDIEITDYVPTGMTLSDADTNAWSGPASGPVTKVLDYIATGAPCATMNIVLTIDDMFMGDQLINNVAITADDGDDIDSDPDVYDTPNDLDDDNNLDEKDGGDDEDPEVIVLNQTYDLALTKELVSAGPFAPGDVVTYAITVYNQGTLDATNVEITDYVPVGMTLSLTDANGWAGPSTGPVTNVIASLPAYEAPVVVEIDLKINDDFMGASLSNNAAITADNGDDVDSDPDVYDTPNDYADNDDPLEEDGGDDEDPALIDIDQSYDLALTKELVSVGPFVPGDVVTYAITVYNQGTLDAADIEITDYVPAGMTLSVTDENGWAGPSTGPVTNVIASLPAYEAPVVVEIDLKINDDFQGSSLSNNAAITADDGEDADSDPDVYDTPDDYSDNDDPLEEDGGDDEDPALIEVEQTYDLALTKELVSAGPFVPGDVVTYAITVYNQGTLHASDIEITDYVPSGMTLSSTDGNGWTGPSTDTVSLVVASAPAYGPPIVVEIDLKINNDFQGESLSNNAAITADDGDDIDSDPDVYDTPDDYSDNDDPLEEDGGDDEDPALIEVEQTYDLALTKKFFSTTDINGDGVMGSNDEVVFTIEVCNQGTLDAANFEVVDYIPDGLILADGQWNESSGKAHYLADLSLDGTPVGEAYNCLTLYITFTVDPNYLGTQIVNWAEISDDSGDDIDSNPDSNNGEYDESTQDDATENENSDEDDHDWAEITIVPAGSLGDTVWKDSNGDGIQNNGEQGIEDVEVHLFDCDGNYLASTETDENGFYLFQPLLGGDYQVQFDTDGLPNDCAFTLQNQGVNSATDSDVNLAGWTECITLAPGEHNRDVDAGLLQLAKIGNYVWYDCNADGIQDGSEEGIANVRVQLHDEQSNLVEVVYTNADGAYLFDDIYPGNYYVKFITTNDLNFTYSNVGGNDNLDSDVNGANGAYTTAITNLSSGECDESSADAGLYECQLIGDLVWFDTDDDGIWDVIENGINGVKVEVYRQIGTDYILHDYTYTGHKPGTPSDDGYWKMCVPPGNYYIHYKVESAGLEAVEANVGSDELVDSDVTHDYGLNTTSDFTISCDGGKCDLGAGFNNLDAIDFQEEAVIGIQSEEDNSLNDADKALARIEEETKKLESASKVYPNPTSGDFTIEIELDHLATRITADIIGYSSQKYVEELELGVNVEPGIHKYRIDGSSLPGGMYHIQLSIGNKRITKRLLKVQ